MQIGNSSGVVVFVFILWAISCGRKRVYVAHNCYLCEPVACVCVGSGSETPLDLAKQYASATRLPLQVRESASVACEWRLHRARFPHLLKLAGSLEAGLCYAAAAADRRWGTVSFHCCCCRRRRCFCCRRRRDVVCCCF